MRQTIKRWVSIGITACILMLAGFAGSAHAALKDGSYQEVANGINGPIKVEVVIKDGKIAEVNLLEHSETKGLGGAAMKKMTAQMIANNTSNVDMISGASTSGAALLSAVQAALLKAGASQSDLSRTVAVNDQTQVLKSSYTFDVVIVGSGGAGLSAAVEAARANTKVAIIEKNELPGGSTMISGADFNAAGSDIQKKLGIEDYPKWHIEDTLKGGDYVGNPKLVETMANNAPAAIKWLYDDIGVDVITDHLFQFGGHRVPRAVSQTTGHGDMIVSRLLEDAEKHGAQIFYSTKATELILNKSGVVTAVKAVNDGKEIVFNANKAVIIATGGFASNVEMRKKYNKEYDERYMSTSAKGSLGEGVIMAEAAGANIIDMQYIQLHPTCNPKTGVMSYLAAGSYIDGGLLINQQGKRFVNELERRDVVAKAIVEQTGNVAYVIWPQELEESSRSLELYPSEYTAMLADKLITKANTLDEAADFFGIDKNQLKQTIQNWGEYAAKKVDPDFNKDGNMLSFAEGPYYIQKITPSAHYTMGGIQINEKAEVLNKSGKAIPHLYAAGEVTGGVHGTNRLGGNAMADIIVFGRIAGQNAAKVK